MYVLFMIIHILCCVILGASVLLQSGKGADMGAAFGGGGQALFGARGTTTVLSKITGVAAAVFFTTSLGLSILSRERSVTASVIPEPAPKEATTPVATATPTATPPPQTPLPAASDIAPAAATTATTAPPAVATPAGQSLPSSSP